MNTYSTLDEYLNLNIAEKPEDWDFSGQNTQSLTHGIHPYPARMIPQVARRLVERYSRKMQLNFDPFCGSGSTLIESILHGRNAMGNDINPLARLITKVRTTPVNPKQLDEFITKILSIARNTIERYHDGRIKVDERIDFANISLWFKPNVIDELELIRRIISDIDDDNIKDFFKICFSKTVRLTSNVYREGDTFIKTMDPVELKKHNPDTYAEFNKTVVNYSSLLKAFSREYSSLEPKPYIRITSEDTRYLKPENIEAENIITSPPYGEERNTISYNRWSKISLYWLGFSRVEIINAEKSTLGANGIRKDSDKLESPILESIVAEVEGENKKLAAEAISFFIDYKHTISVLYKILKPTGHCCIVLGNRSLKKRRVPMDKVTVDFAKSLGFKHLTTYYRNIPSKSIPWSVSKGETISSENIIILQKE